MKRRVVIVALAGTCLSMTTAMAGPNPAMRAKSVTPPGGIDAILLSNNIPGDGRLEVSPDAYGAYQNGYGSAGNGDTFDPPGAEPPLTPMFSTAFFVFNTATLDRVVLSESTASFVANYNTSANPATFTIAVTSPQVGSDSDGDGVTDTSTSSFTITGGNAGVNLSVTLVQRVYKPAAGVSRFRQTWTFTNNGAAAADLKVMKHVDMDIFATPVGLASWADVAGSIDSVGCQPITVYEREPSPAPPTTPIAFALATPSAGYVYYAARSGYDPDGAGPDPAMAFGTDFQIWNAYGLPPSWANQTAFVGPAPTTGEDPNEFPVGGVAPNDGFMGYQWVTSIPAGGNRTFATVTAYGSRSHHLCYADCNCDGTLSISDFGCYQTSFVSQNPYADCNGVGGLTIADFACFQTTFVQGCP